MTATHPLLDSSWWDQPELRPALASRDVAGIFRWLQRHGWSQTRDVINEAQHLRSGRGVSRLAEIATAASQHPHSFDAVDLIHQLESVRKAAPKALTA